MIKTVVIKEIDTVMQLLGEQTYRPEINRYRCQYLYRGMSDVSFAMQTSLVRNCKEYSKILEPSILKNFTKYAALEDPTIEKSIWRQMILGQHHGLPTRLLDWSHSSLIGLHFAVSENDMDAMEKHDCVVWRIDMKELHNILPEPYLAPLRAEQTVTYTVDTLSKVTESLSQYDRDMGDHGMVVIEPPSMDPRIVTQYSFFSIVPLGMESIEDFLDKYTDNTVKYVIDKSLRWRIRDMLDHLNMSERTIYPGLDGLTKWITRHYFVKPANDGRNPEELEKYRQLNERAKEVGTK